MKRSKTLDQQIESSVTVMGTGTIVLVMFIGAAYQDGWKKPMSQEDVMLAAAYVIVILVLIVSNALKYTDLRLLRFELEGSVVPSVELIEEDEDAEEEWE